MAVCPRLWPLNEAEGVSLWECRPECINSTYRVRRREWRRRRVDIKTIRAIRALEKQHEQELCKLRNVLGLASQRSSPVSQCSQ